MNRRHRKARMLVAAAFVALVAAGAAFRGLAGCGGFDLPFTDLGSETTFCAAIAEAYFSGLANGTSATTYDPSGLVPRDQMAAFITRTLDQSLLRGARRTALGQLWTSNPHYDEASLGLTNVGISPFLLKSDGADIWVANSGSGAVSRVRASDGKNLGTWTGATNAYGVLVALGKVFVTGSKEPGSLYMLDPTMSPGAVTSVATLGNGAAAIAFDGGKIWTSNQTGSVSIVTPGSTLPWSVTTVSTGFHGLEGILFDGNNIWVTDVSAGHLLELDFAGSILQTVSIAGPAIPAFDGHNIWVPFGSGSLAVVRASDGTILKTFSAGNGDQNGLDDPVAAAFDGQRILVTNALGGVSLFKAADLSVIGNFPTPGFGSPFGVCSDGFRFWVGDSGGSVIGRF